MIPEIVWLLIQNISAARKWWVTTLDLFLKFALNHEMAYRRSNASSILLLSLILWRIVLILSFNVISTSFFIVSTACYFKNHVSQCRWMNEQCPCWAFCGALSLLHSLCMLVFFIWRHVSHHFNLQLITVYFVRKLPSPFRAIGWAPWNKMSLHTEHGTHKH
jgi:hypothetical protein